MVPSSFRRTFEKGQIVIATIDEVLSATEMICAIDGHLLRLQNRTGSFMQKGLPVRLQVIAVDPLQFQIFDVRKLRFERVV